MGRPNLPDLEGFLDEIRGIFARGWLTNDGPLVRQLEGELATVVGVDHCIAVSNGTVALELLLRGCDLTGEVIVPSFTFVATAHAVQWIGLTPVFADVTEHHSLDPASVEARITARTSGILAVHLWGRPCDVDGLTEVARRYRLELIFDASHALGCSHGGRMIGGFGRAEVFSLHATKFVSAAEGGFVATNDAELARRLRLMRNFGFAGFDNVVYLGTNGKMSELSAAFALASLKQMEMVTAVNRRNLNRWKDRLSDVSGLRVVVPDERQRANYQYVIVEVDRSCPLTRDELVTVLHAENILARRYFAPGAHRSEPYRTLFPDAGSHLPRTEDLCRRVLALPTGTAVSDETIDVIAECIVLATRGAARIRERLSDGSARPGSGT